MLPSFTKRLVFGSLFLVLLFLSSLYANQNKAPDKAPEVSEIKKEIKGTQATSSPIPSAFISSSDKTLYKVLKVIDGDTITVDIGGIKETLRLIGIDTPETVDPRKPVQCFGREASDRAKTLLTGKMVSVEADPTQGERDKYKRLLRYIFLEDGTNYNKLMILDGYAHEYTYDLPYKYQQEFKDAERLARENKKGLWADNVCSVSVSAAPKQVQASAAQGMGNYPCDCNKTCGKITSCNEAYYQLQSCKCSARDSDGDGIPCEALCSN